MSEPTPLTPETAALIREHFGPRLRALRRRQRADRIDQVAVVLIGAAGAGFAFLLAWICLVMT